MNFHAAIYLFVRRFANSLVEYLDISGLILGVLSYFFFFFVFLKEEITFDSRSRNYFVSFMLSFLLFQRVYTICIDGEYRFLFSFEYQVISYTYILFIGIKRNIGTKEPLQNNYCLYKIFFVTVIDDISSRNNAPHRMNDSCLNHFREKIVSNLSR